jgi:hypothetical protein
VPKEFKVFWETATKNLKPVRDRIHFFMIESAGKQLCYVGDLTHHPVLLLEKDTDPKQSAQSRVKMLTMLAEKRIPLVPYHFAWPGIAHVGKQGDGFRYFPSPMQMSLESRIESRLGVRRAIEKIRRSAGAPAPACSPADRCLPTACVRVRRCPRAAYVSRLPAQRPRHHRSRRFLAAREPDSRSRRR